MDSRAIADLIRARRRELGLSQRALAKAAAVSQSLIAEIESGKRLASTRSLDKLTQFLGITIGEPDSG